MRVAVVLSILVPGSVLAPPVFAGLGNLDSGDGALIALGLAIGALIARRRRGLPESAD